jgi:heterodisulfide reductase subunit A
MEETPRKIGLFLCRCGNNIAQNVDIESLQTWALGRDDIACAVAHDLLCSPSGRDFILETIDKNRMDAVLVAACSPKVHESTFREVGAQRGINLAHVNMANIREHAAWVTPDAREATEKARVLINAALRRCREHADLENRTMGVRTDLVIIGGGIAGIEAALTAAEAGRKVTIIEKEISLGGSVIKTEELGPSMECAPCILAPRLSMIRENKNITVITNAEVTDVLGFYGNFSVRGKRKVRYVTEACIGCEACFEVCPVSVSSAFHLGMGRHKAIYTAFPGSVPAAAAIDPQGCLRLKGESCNACVEACAFSAINFDDKEERFEIPAGAVIMATGHAGPPAAALSRFGADHRANIYTMEEYERIASSNGPTGGEIRLADGSAPKSLAVIHCAGSMDPAGLSYCSGICCMTSLKAGELFRKKLGDGVTVVNIYDRLVFASAAAERFYALQQHEGTRFIKTDDLRSIAITQQNGHLAVTGAGLPPISADMVVLSTGMGPGVDTANLADRTGLELDSCGFFKPDNPLLNAVGASIPGIYAAGSCASPCDVSTAITRGRAAAGDALAHLIEGRSIPLEAMTSHIDENGCAGCKLCLTVCPYRAISYDAAKKISIVNEAICRGCGTCAAACGSGAIQAKHFTTRQIFAEIEGVLHGAV